MRHVVILSEAAVILSAAKDLLFNAPESRFFGRRPQNDREAGFTYLTALFVIAFMGLGLAMTGEVWRTAVMREREAELLYVGNQYRLAIERYYKRGAMQYPRALDDLLKDPRDPGTRRYLRKHYSDPITGTNEWGLVKGPDGGIMGVHSRSEEKPIKTGGFGVENKEFEQAAMYSAWKFVYAPGLQKLPGMAPLQQLNPGVSQPLPDAARQIMDAVQPFRDSMPPPETPPQSNTPPPSSVVTPRAPDSSGPLILRHE